jgi:Chemotaxis protein; stimulates methylation of MCP proteins
MDISIRLLQNWVGREKIRIEKIASGAAIIIWDASKRRAAATHFYSTDEAKIEEKIKELLASLQIQDNDFSKIRVKIVGGADVAGLNVGRKFIASLFNVIKRMGLPVGGYDIGGNVTRSVTFDPVTGRCIVSYLIGGEKEI